MGKKGNWFVAVKKAFSPESKEKREPNAGKSKKKWGFGQSKLSDPASSLVEARTVPLLPSEEMKLTEVEQGQNKHAYSVAIATAVAAEAAVAAAHAAAEVVRLTTVPRIAGISNEEVAAIKIQTVFRGYLARRALQALRGLVRLKNLVHGQAVRRQATTTLRCMQTLARVQSQIRSRRIRMLEENQSLQRQLLQKCEKELTSLRAYMGEEWDDSLHSKERIEAKLLSKYEAAIRRERALAYAFSHQQLSKNSSRSLNPMFTDSNNPHWGWSWLERWMAARPWEIRSLTDRETADLYASSSVKSENFIGGEISGAYYARREINSDRPSLVAKKSSRQASRHSPSTPHSKASSVAGKPKTVSPIGGGWCPAEDDLRSIYSLQSEWHRRHSLPGSLIRDDESLASSSLVPNYMAATQSAKAKARLHNSPSGDRQETLERGLSVKKRLSFPTVAAGGSPMVAARRHSGPPKVETSLRDIDVNTEHTVSNGGSSR